VSPAIFPDQILRHPDGWFYWVSRKGEVRVYSADGALKQKWDAKTSMLWAQMLPSGDLDVLIAPGPEGVPVRAMYSIDGERRAVSPAWLTVSSEAPEAGRAFFFARAPKVEVAAHFPYLRFAGQTVTWVDILPANQRSLILQTENQGLPAPLGNGYQGDGRLMPTVLWSDLSDDGSLWLLLNGGSIVRVKPRGKPDLIEVPQVGGPKFISTAMSVTGNHVALLTRVSDAKGKRVEFRVFETRADNGAMTTH
jgi:hypothetical protein